jgi:multidrug resistance efflux pump
MGGLNVFKLTRPALRNKPAQRHKPLQRRPLQRRPVQSVRPVAKIKSARLLMTTLLISMLSTSALSEQVSTDNLLVTGRVVAKGGQDIIVPRDKNWQIELKWLAEEGLPLKKGDVVAVFDGSSLESELEQLENDIEKNQQEHASQLLSGEQDILAATLEVEEAKSRVKIAEIDVNQPKALFAAFDYEEFVFEAKVAALNLKSAQLKLKNKQQEHQAKIAKIELNRVETQRKMEKTKSLLANKTIRAELAGSAVYSNHPHRGTKIIAGDNVQMGWKIAKIPNGNDMYIAAKIADVDLQKLKKDMPVTIIFDIDGSQRFQGKISQINTHGENHEPWGKAKYYDVLIDIESSLPFKLSAGMSVLGIINVEANLSNSSTQLVSNSKGSPQKESAQ